MQTETTPRSCHVSRHLGGCEYVVYDVLAGLLKGRGMSEVTISCRHLAKMTIYGKNTVAAALRELESAGWIERYPAEITGGRYKADTYTLNSHDEWAEKHAGQCPVPKSGTGSKSA